jgi:hypothetical protein
MRIEEAADDERKLAPGKIDVRDEDSPSLLTSASARARQPACDLEDLSS